MLHTYINIDYSASDDVLAVTDSNTEDELLDKDEYFDWEVDNLLLEINEVLDDGSDIASCRTSTDQGDRSNLHDTGHSSGGMSLSSIQQSISARTSDLLEHVSIGSRTSENSVTSTDGASRPLVVSSLKERLFQDCGQGLAAGVWRKRSKLSLQLLMKNQQLGKQQT